MSVATEEKVRLVTFFDFTDGTRTRIAHQVNLRGGRGGPEFDKTFMLDEQTGRMFLAGDSGESHKQIWRVSQEVLPESRIWEKISEYKGFSPVIAAPVTKTASATRLSYSDGTEDVVQHSSEVDDGRRLIVFALSCSTGKINPLGYAARFGGKDLVLIQQMDEQGNPQGG